MRLDRIIDLWSEECAQGMTEYSLILGLIVMFILSTFIQMVKDIPSGIQPVGEKLSE